jgi:hypothetical protein
MFITVAGAIVSRGRQYEEACRDRKARRVYQHPTLGFSATIGIEPMIRNKTDAGNSIETSHEYNQNHQATPDCAVGWVETTDITGSVRAEGR